MQLKQSPDTGNSVRQQDMRRFDFPTSAVGQVFNLRTDF